MILRNLKTLAARSPFFGAFGAGLVAMVAAASPAAVSAQETIAPTSVLDLPETPNLAPQTDPNVRRPTAKVNGAIITGTDVDHRVALTLNANANRVSPEELVRLRAQTLRNLIDEVIQIQAAAAQEMPVEQAEIDQTYAQIAQQNFGRTPAQMDASLVEIGSSPASLKRQIEGELAWSRLRRRNITPFVNVSDEEVNEMMERMQADRGTQEFRLGEIYLSATPATQEQVLANAQQIVEQLRQGGNFVAYARQFSEASTKSVGGDLGWLRGEQLPATLANEARQMQPNELRGPIEVPGGYSILVMIDRRQILTADPRDAVLSLKQISMPFPQGASQEALNGILARFGEAVSRMNGCGTADEIAAGIGAQVVTSDQVAARGLPAELQQTLLALQVGQTTPPFGSVDEGVRVLMLCGRDDPQIAEGPSFDETMARIENERVSKRAQRYLRDLRRDAIIEYN